jgi:hypothetical protein
MWEWFEEGNPRGLGDGSRSSSRYLLTRRCLEKGMTRHETFIVLKGSAVQQVARSFRPSLRRCLPYRREDWLFLKAKFAAVALTDLDKAKRLDGRQYEIDLSDENVAKLRDALAPFITAARTAGGRGSGRGRRAQRQPARETEKPARSSREEAAAIRQWAREHGQGRVAERGRIPRSVMEAYQATS